MFDRVFCCQDKERGGQVVGFSLSEALQMCTLTPARILGREAQVGQLAPGCSADVLVLDRATLTPQVIMLGGGIVSAG